MCSEVLINIQADRKESNLLLSFVLRKMFLVNALGLSEDLGEGAFEAGTSGRVLL